MSTLATMTTTSSPNAGAGSGASQFVAFTADGNTYAVPITTVQEIRSWQATTPLPNRPRASRGVLDIRGTIVEVLELGVLLGAAPVTPGPESVVIVLMTANRPLGILADGVYDIIQTRDDQLLTPPEHGDDDIAEAIVTHEDRMVTVIRPERLAA